MICSALLVPSCAQAALTYPGLLAEACLPFECSCSALLHQQVHLGEDAELVLYNVSLRQGLLGAVQMGFWISG